MSFLPGTGGLGGFLPGVGGNAGGGGASGPTPAEQLATMLSGAGESGFWLFDDLTYLRQNDDGTTEVTAADPVGWVEDLSGNGNHGTATSTARPVATNGLTFDGVNDRLNLPVFSSNMTVLVAFRTTDDTFALGSRTAGGSGSSRRLLTAEDGSVSTAIAIVSPVVDGSSVSSGTTMDEIHTLVSDGEWHIASHPAADLSVWTTGITIGDYVGSAGYTFAGEIIGVVAIDNTAISRDAYDVERMAVAVLTERILANAPATDVASWEWFSSFAWTWFNDERVIEFAPGRYAVGGIAGNGDVLVGEYTSGKYVAGSRLYPAFQADDHDNPALLKRADGKILAFYTKHNHTAYYASVSSRANDVSEFETAVDIDAQLGQSNYSYGDAYRLASGRIVLFFRATNASTSDWSWHYSYTDDPSGLTGWQTAVQLSTFARPYHKFRQNGAGRIDIVVNDGHPGAVASNKVYHYYFLDTGGTITFHKSDGTDITSLIPFAGSELTEVYDAADGRSWVSDLQLDGSGNPVATFTVYPDAVDGSPDTVGDIRAYQARWSGLAWSHEEICTMGATIYNTAVSTAEPYYSGGICGVPGDPDTVFVGRQVDGAGESDTVNGIHQIFRYTKDGTWSGEQLTTGTDKSFRPFVPQGTADTVFFPQGRYDTYYSWDTAVKALPVAA